MESEDRQVLSIEAQVNELKAVALNKGLDIVEVYSEAKSAKSPGRPIFDKMMKTVFEKEEAIILCWKLDRLARNPVDGGNLIWALEQKKAREIITPSRNFRDNGDDKFWMQLEFGMAKKYVDDLSENVMRGNRAKLEKGILPGKAPLGYLNDRETRTIEKDPDRFHLVRRIWDIILSGDYNINHVLKIAAEDWGLTTRQSKRQGGSPLTRSGLYRLLGDPFYYGVIRRKGEMFRGIHEPMISKEEFGKVQGILRKPKKCPKTKEFPYTGMIRCKECGSMVTAEEKTNRYGYHYTYYRCTKRKGGHNNVCQQKYIRSEELEAQILAFLERLHLPEGFFEWGVNQLKSEGESEKEAQATMKRSLSKSLTECRKKLENLLELRLKDILTDEEYLSKKKHLMGMESNLRTKINRVEENSRFWFEPSRNFLSFVTLAKKSFEKGDAAIKRRILSTVSSNLFLEDKKLLIEAKKPFSLIIHNSKSSLGWTM